MVTLESSSSKIKLVVLSCPKPMIAGYLGTVSWFRFISPVTELHFRVLEPRTIRMVTADPNDIHRTVLLHPLGLPCLVIHFTADSDESRRAGINGTRW